MPTHFDSLWCHLKRSLLPVVIGSSLVAAPRLTAGSESSSSCSEEHHVSAQQVETSDYFLADKHRYEFYGVWPNGLYTYEDQGGTGFFNTFEPGLFTANPRLPDHLLGSYIGDSVAIQLPPSLPQLAQNTITHSKDGGKSWHASRLPTRHLSQAASAAAVYSRSGKTIYALGFFSDTYTNPKSKENSHGLFDFSYYTSYLPQAYGPAATIMPTGPVSENAPSRHVRRNYGDIDYNTTIGATLLDQGVEHTVNPACGLFICRSKDGGKTFSDPVLISATQTDAYLGELTEGDTGSIYGSNGLVDQPGTLIVDPHKANVLNAVWYRTDNVSLLWGSLYGSRSFNRGKTWISNPHGKNRLKNRTRKPLYALATDENFANLVIKCDGSYLSNFPNVGQAIGTGAVVVTDVGQGGNHGKPVYIVGTNRFYPIPNQATPAYTHSPDDTLFDHAVIISKDRGKLWGDGNIFRKTGVDAVALPQFIFATAHDPRFPLPESNSLIVTDGALNQTLAASPKTGRVYYVWQAGNFAICDDPDVNQFYPEIQLSLSSGTLDEIGQNWTLPIKANRTPNHHKQPEKSQAFNPNVAVNKDGVVGVVYTDFRNFDFTQIGNPYGTALATTWLAFYKELDTPVAGEYGNGLQFIEEVQVSPVFDAAIAGGTPYTGITPGKYTSLTVDSKGDFIVAYPVTNKNHGLHPIPPGFEPYSSYNIQENRSNRVSTFIKVMPSPCH